MKKMSSMILALALVLSLAMTPARAEEKRTPEAALATMSTEEKVSQMLMPAFRWYPDGSGERQSVTELPADTASLLAKYGFAGVTLFAQNTGDTAKAARLVDDMQKANASAEGRTQLLIAIDQEGGRVTRLGHGTQMPGNMALGAVNDTSLTGTAASIIGGELMSMGINFNFAPVLDVNSNPANPVIGTRSFSDDPVIVATQGVSYMKALQATGAISTFKHFPGHGDTATDSHTGLPLVDKSYEELKACELIPFRVAIEAGADAVMTAHIQYPQIEKNTYTSKETGEAVNLPATLSKTILTDILRGDMGFDGVIITDAMEMDAIAKHFERFDAAKLAIEAGVDILLMPVDTSTPEGLADLEAYIHKLTEMVQSGEISEKQVDAAVLRVLRLKADHGLTAPYEGIDAEASQIVGSAAHHEAEWALTKKTVTLVKNDNGTLPLTKENQKIAVLTAYDNEVLSMEYAVGRLRDEGKLAKGTEITVQSIQKKTAEEAIACAAGAEHVVIITELGSAAGLNNDTAKTVDALIESVHQAGGDAIIMCCSLPYDAARYQAADAIVIAWSARGMSEDPRVTDGAVAQYGPSMPAALYLMLSPDETPAGKLPVNIPRLTDELTYSDEILYPRGFGLRYAPRFTDVSADAYYASAVDWAVEKEITNGKSSESFAPDATVTRAEAVTFLWHMAGKPEPAQTETFADVESDANNGWYKTAVQWAVEKGITNGTGNGQFSPTVTCARGMILTMLYRMQGSPWDAAMAATLPENSEDMTLEDFGNAIVQAMVEGVRSGGTLSDVHEGDYFELPVLWAMMNAVLDKNQIDTDATPVAIQPGAPCPRGEMVYFLYHASGDAPAPKPEGAVETGTIPETVVLDKEGVKLTAKSIESYGLSDAHMTLTVENGSQKTLRVDMNDFYVNTFAISPQVSSPVENEDGIVFYADAVVAPGETKDVLVMLNSIGDKGIANVCELEMTAALVEVEKDEEDYYSYVGDFATGDAVRIQTSLYAEGASYDMEGTTVYDKDGLKLIVTKAENDEYGGPQLTVFAYNGGSESVSIELAELKLDGESFEGFCSLNVPAGKRSAEKVYVSYDFDNVPVARRLS